MRGLRLALVLGAAALAPSLSLADDGFAQVFSGSASLQKGKHPAISMSSETVRIALGAQSYAVDATFWFYNDGPSTTVAVGFPWRGRADGVRDAALSLDASGPSDFRTWVDGVEFPVRDMPEAVTVDGKPTPYQSARQLAEASKDEDHIEGVEERRWLVKETPFKAKRTTVVRVSYTAVFDAGNNSLNAAYIYGTGGSWKGPIGRVDFIIEASSTAWARSISLDERWSVARVDEYSCRYTATNVAPDPDDKIEIAVGEPKHYDSQPWEHDLKSYASAPVPDRLLACLSARQLKYLRNSFFALHGREFKDPELLRYFWKRSRRSYGWYEPRADFKESDLTEAERRNVLRIAEQEKKLSPSRKPEL
jgi:hypothetical protein